MVELPVLKARVLLNLVLFLRVIAVVEALVAPPRIATDAMVKL